MGLAPTFDDYAGGAACAVCKDEIFNGKTPFFIEAWVFSVDLCPPDPGPSPNGVHLLSQKEPCLWELLGPVWRFQWELTPALSRFDIQAGPSFSFHSVVEEICIDTFDNELLICAHPFVIGINGWVTIFWGPGIGL
ncbi:hypothetical protein ES703_105268 [subsurface metagenome]